MALAKAFCGAGVGFQGEPKEGKLNLVAQRNGLLKVAVDALTDINLLGDVMCASRHSNTLVKAGDVVAGTRAIPLTVAKAVVNEAVRIAESHKGLFEVKALRRARTGLVITGNEVFTRLIEDRFEEVLRKKIDRIGSKVIGVAFAPDNPSLIASEIQRLISQGADLILTTGGMSVDPDDVTRDGIRKAGGSAEFYGAPVLPGAMFMMADIRWCPHSGNSGLWFVPSNNDPGFDFTQDTVRRAAQPQGYCANGARRSLSELFRMPVPPLPLWKNAVGFWVPGLWVQGSKVPVQRRIWASDHYDQ